MSPHQQANEEMTLIQTKVPHGPGEILPATETHLKRLRRGSYWIRPMADAQIYSTRPSHIGIDDMIWQTMAEYETLD